MSNLALTFQNQPLTVEIINGNPWFYATQVAEALEYSRTSDMMRIVADDEKGTHLAHTLGGKQEVSILNESGLYRVIFRSEKAEAEIFRKWVFSEVLPSIRKTGGYDLKIDAAEDDLDFIARLRIKAISVGFTEKAALAYAIHGSQSRRRKLNATTKAAETLKMFQDKLALKSAAKALSYKKRL